MGKFFKGVVKFSVAAAAVGGLCYASRTRSENLRYIRITTLMKRSTK